ncbi:MAG: DUF421 domain-containing protein [Legionella longbeachae]|nr:DUF421 domain-containing protein [Legionella longbeachae]
MFSYFYLINQDQNIIYIFIRAILLLIICTLMIRFGNRRFKLNNSFDLLSIVISGGVVSRGINGPASLISTLVALSGIILVHKTLAIFSKKFPSFEVFIKGKRYLLIKNGVLQKQTLNSLNITEKDIEEQMRQQINTLSYEKVICAYLERTGNITFVIKEK